MGSSFVCVVSRVCVRARVCVCSFGFVRVSGVQNRTEVKVHPRTRVHSAHTERHTESPSDLLRHEAYLCAVARCTFSQWGSNSLCDYLASPHGRYILHRTRPRGVGGGCVLVLREGDEEDVCSTLK